MREGYRFLHMPDHPRATRQGYYAEHRVIMEKHLGRPLDRREVVHHINHRPGDNRIENLMLYASSGEHKSKEHRLPRANGKWAKAIARG